VDGSDIYKYRIQKQKEKGMRGREIRRREAHPISSLRLQLGQKKERREKWVDLNRAGIWEFRRRKPTNGNTRERHEY